ncbi:MAG: hypothetical protein JNL70_27245 [Saprospiraceae bacterium]|nr:hypothetical protein [Saprospiraceae bacterium]
MKDSKLLEILNTFNKKEKKDFGEFLAFSAPRTRYEVATTDVMRLWTVLETLEKNFKQETLDVETIYPLVFPKKAFVKGRLEKAMSALYREVEKYVSFVFYADNSSHNNKETVGFSRSWAMLHLLSERQLHNRFENTVERLRVEVKSVGSKDTQGYLQAYMVEYADNRYQEQYNTKQGDVNLSATLDSLDTFYVVARLEHLLTLAAQKRHIVIDVQQQFEVLPHLKNIIACKQLSDFPIVKAYIEALDLLLGQGDWLVFRQSLEQAHDFLTFEQRQTLCAIERNHCAALYNAGQKEYIHLLVDLFAAHLEAGYLYYHNYLIPSTLLNIIMVGTKVKRFDWVKEVIEKYSDKIMSADEVQEITRINWALYYFAVGQYTQALDALQSPYKFKDIYYELTQRRLEIKIYYEQNAFDMCNSRTEAFKNYLFNWGKKKKSDHLPPLVFEGNNNFVNMVTQLINTTHGDVERIAVLKDKMDNNRTYGDREWLLEKIEGLY